MRFRVSSLAAGSECQRSMVTVPPAGPAPGVSPVGVVSSPPPPQAASESERSRAPTSATKDLDKVCLLSWAPSPAFRRGQYTPGRKPATGTDGCGDVPRLFVEGL